MKDRTKLLMKAFLEMEVCNWILQKGQCQFLNRSSVANKAYKVRQHYLVLKFLLMSTRNLFRDGSFIENMKILISFLKHCFFHVFVACLMVCIGLSIFLPFPVMKAAPFATSFVIKSIFLHSRIVFSVFLFPHSFSSTSFTIFYSYSFFPVKVVDRV